MALLAESDVDSADATTKPMPTNESCEAIRYSDRQPARCVCSRDSKGREDAFKAGLKAVQS